MPSLLIFALSLFLYPNLPDHAVRVPCSRSAVEVSITNRAQSTAVQSELAKVGGLWTKYWIAKQLDQLLALYAEDAVFLTGSGDRFTGKAAIRDLFKQALESHNSEITVRSIRTEVSNDIAYDSGDYRETIVPASGGSRMELQGNYVIVFKRQKSGKWLIVEHVWTDKILSGKS